MTLPDPRQTPVISVAEAGALLGLGRSKAYVEARRWLDTGGREGIPVRKFGRALRVPTAALLELVGQAS